ncbi:reverse transcriptase domain-containing protein [Tanacetum coccineum]
MTFRHGGTANRMKKEKMALNGLLEIHINQPFLEAMIHMSKGAKVLKDQSHKEKLEKAASSIKLSEELKNALADLGASINLISHSLFRRLGISKLKPIRMSIQLDDRSIKYPIGVCENLLVKENNQLPIVISSVLSATEKARLLKVLRDHKGAISWSIVDIKGIVSSFYTHKILMEDDFKPSVQPQRRVNLNIKEVVKREVIKLLNAGLIYPIFDSPWVSPVQVVPKKGGMTVVKNEKNELIPQRTITEWRVCINYRKLNNATQKDHFPLSFIDQILERLAGHEYYCFLYGFSGWILLLQEFDIEIRDKKGTENLAADHFSQLENPNLGKLTKAKIRDLFPEEQLMTIFDEGNEPWKFFKNNKIEIFIERGDDVRNFPDGVASPGRTTYLLEDKQIPSVGVFDEVSFYTLFQALGWLLEEIHVSWARLEKKQTRLQLYTHYLEENHTILEESKGARYSLRSCCAPPLGLDLVFWCTPLGLYLALLTLPESAEMLRFDSLLHDYVSEFVVAYIMQEIIEKYESS